MNESVDPSLLLRLLLQAHFKVHLILECTTLTRYESPITLRVDPRLYAFSCGTLSLAFQIEILGMVAAPNIGVKGLQEMKRVPVVLIDAGIFFRNGDLVTGIETGTVRKHDFVGFTSFNKSRDPCRCTLCVARSVIGGQDDFAESHRVAISQHAIDFDGRLAHDLPVLAVMEIALSSVFGHRDILFHDRYLGARELLHVRKRTGVIGVPVTVDDDLYVLGLEAELTDRSTIIGPDLGVPVFRRMLPSDVTTSHELRPRV